MKAIEDTGKPHDTMKLEIQHSEKGVDSCKLANGKGISATFLNYGAAIARIEVPDRDGNIADVVLGHENPANYVGARFYLGATVGRFANRIAGGKFILDGKEYQVTTNSKGNLLHGGTVGFDKKFWKARVVEEKGDPAVEFILTSPDGDEGFPGTMEVKVMYTLTSKNELMIEYVATSDRPTVINLTNHGYFNLTGSGANSILNHVLYINADSFTPTDGASLPTGEIADVSGTPMDFRKFNVIGDRIGEEYEQLTQCKGYDKNWVLNNYTGDVREAATLYEPASGRVLEIFTDQPGLQFYSGNYLDGSLKGKGGAYYRERSGLCLECQHFPNSPNVEKFPSTALMPGDAYKQTTIYRFSIDPA